MLVGSRRFVMSTARYRAVSDSTGHMATDDDDDRDYEDTIGQGGASSSYESFSTCELMRPDDASDPVTARSHPRTGNSTAFRQCDFRFDLFFSFSFVPVLSNLLTKTC